MCDEKKVSEIQEAGYIGESDFENWATKVGYYPSKIRPDHGIDFLCQVKGSKTPEKASWSMPGKTFLVAVRSTEEDGQKVLLSRSDANLMLADSSLVLAMVRRAPVGQMGQVSIRFGDESFVRELHAFLCGTAASHSVSFGTGCTDLAAIRYNVERLFRRSYQDQLAYLKTELKLGEVLKGPRLRVVHDGHGGYSVIISSDFLDQFDVTAPGAQDELHQAVFGRSDLLEQRLACLPLHQTVQNVVQDLPRPILIGGPLLTAGGHAEVEASNSHESIRAKFESRSVGGWFGYSHDSGVFIRFSKAEARGSQHIHRIEAGADPDAQVDDLRKNDIAPFLKCCTSDTSQVKVLNTDLEVGMNLMPSLSSLGWLVTYLEDLSGCSFVNSTAWRIGDVQEEDLRTLGFLSDLHGNSNMLDGFGFALGQVPFDQLARLPVDIDLPVCMNLRQKGIVCWLTGKGSLIKDATTGTLVGMQLIQALSLRFEEMTKPFPTDGFPRLKVCSEWPGIPLHENKVTYAGKEDWGVAMVCHRTEAGQKDASV